MINRDHIAFVYVLERPLWPSGAFRKTYDSLLETLRAHGAEPDRVGATGPEFRSKKYATFRRVRKRIEASDFDELTSLSMARLAPGGDSPASEWLFRCDYIKPGYVVLGWVPALAPSLEEPLHDVFGTMAATMGGNYGYLFRRQMQHGPDCYPSGVRFVLYGRRDTFPVTGLYQENIGGWSRERQANTGLLRDIYAQNYLSDEYLSAPIGDTASTLREWIEDQPSSRGILAPFADALTEWRVPIENIPAIREQLFRAGRIFYCRFFSERFDQRNTPNPFYRPRPREPWDAPNPIPEIFRAGYYAEKEPDLIY